MNTTELGYEQFSRPSALDEAQMMEELLPQVQYIARRIHERLPQHVPFEDLVNEGVLGLIEAYRKFDPTRNVQFKTYAKFRIRGAIIDSLREWDWSPRPLRDREKTVTAAKAKLANELGRVATEEEVASELGMELEKFQELLGRISGLSVMNQQAESIFDSGEDEDIIESARADESLNPFEIYSREELRSVLAEAIETLSKKEQIVISLYYVEELTMKEIAATIDVGESRVSQIHSSALSKLHRRLQLTLGAARA
jgi:RNA polymerase sigma factor for flagellar operon FliA